MTEIRSEVQRPPVNETSSFRDPVIDVLRGICLVSMVTSHLTLGVGGRSVINDVIHLPLFVDGAAGFIFLSGVSVSLADGGRIRRGVGRARRNRWFLERMMFIYILHVAMTVGAIALFLRTSWPEWAGPSTFSPGDLVDVLSLRRVVPYMDVLPIYVICLAITPLALWSRSRSALVRVSAISGAVYVCSLGFPELTAIDNSSNGEPIWVIGAWQVLYFGGIVAGVKWFEIRRLLTDDRRMVAALTGAAAALIMFAYRVMTEVAETTQDTLLTDWRRSIDENVVLRKAYLPAPNLLAAVALGIGVYVLLDWGIRKHRSWFVPLEMLGRRSLRVYLGSCVLVAVVWLVLGSSPDLVVIELTNLCGVAVLVGLSALPAIGERKAWSI